MAAKILIVDSESVERYLKTFLQEQGYRVEIDSTPRVLERIREESFDLLIVALELRSREAEECVDFDGISWKETGLEIIKRLRNGEFSGNKGTKSNVPVIALTTLYEGCPELACVCYSKPFSLRQIFETIKMIIPPAGGRS